MGGSGCEWVDVGGSGSDGNLTTHDMRGGSGGRGTVALHKSVGRMLKLKPWFHARWARTSRDNAFWAAFKINFPEVSIGMASQAASIVLEVSMIFPKYIVLSTINH